MKTRIAVFGLGGVGGYIGGLLASYYADNDSIEIIFIARGEALKNIKENGLLMETTSGNFTAIPSLATDSPEECGIVDYIIYCTKSYDVQSGVESIKPMIDKNTVIIPFLNGVDGEEMMRNMLPENDVWSGCVFIVSEIIKPGIIRQGGTIARYFFGSKDISGNGKGLEFEKICRDADIDARYAEDIERRVWEKFHFISPVATITTYLHKSVGIVSDTPEYQEMLLCLMKEFNSIVKALKIEVSEDIIEKNLKVVGAMPYDATSSMERDSVKGGKTELEALTGYIVKTGAKLGISVPTYEKIYNEINKKGCR